MKYLVVFAVGLVTGMFVWMYQSRKAMIEYTKGVNEFWDAYTGRNR